MTLREITPETLAFETFVQRLTKANLPSADLLDEGGRYYALGETGGDALAFGGLVPLGEEALLRSVVVPDAARGSGLGGLMVDGLAQMAGDHGFKRLWLLTTDADRYFARLGFAAMDRAAAPEALAKTQQFSSLCPSSAVVMCRTLA